MPASSQWLSRSDTTSVRTASSRSSSQNSWLVVITHRLSGWECRDGTRRTCRGLAISRLLGCPFFGELTFHFLLARPRRVSPPACRPSIRGGELANWHADPAGELRRAAANWRTELITAGQAVYPVGSSGGGVPRRPPAWRTGRTGRRFCAIW